MKQPWYNGETEAVMREARDIMNGDISTKSYFSARELPAEKYSFHSLTGNYTGFHECHILPDWLLIYAIKQDKLMTAKLFSNQRPSFNIKNAGSEEPAINSAPFNQGIPAIYI